MMMRLHNFFIKSVIAVSVVFILLSFIGFALDKHYIESSDACAMCKAKSCSGSVLHSHSVEFYPAKTCYHPVEHVFGIVLFSPLQLKNKAPPASS